MACDRNVVVNILMKMSPECSAFHAFKWQHKDRTASAGVYLSLNSWIYLLGNVSGM